MISDSATAIQRNCGPVTVLVFLLAACSPPDPAPDREPACRQPVRDAAVQWYLPPPDRALLNAWCATVGAPAIDAVGDSAATNLPDSVVVIAWNMHVGGGNLRQLIADLRQGRFTNGQPVRHFVLLLQEALRVSDALPLVAPDEVPDRIVDVDERDSTRTEIVGAARQLGLSYIYVPSMRNGAANEDRGNAIVSSMPLDDFMAIELPFERQRRVSVAASVNAADTALLFVSVHLENRSRDLLMSFGSGRLRQAAAIMQVLPRNTPAVLGGDFNTWFVEGAETSIRYMREFFSRTPDTDIGATQQTFAFAARTTDHLFFRLPPGWLIAYRRIDDSYGSDHFPVMGVAWRP